MSGDAERYVTIAEVARRLSVARPSARQFCETHRLIRRIGIPEPSGKIREIERVRLGDLDEVTAGRDLPRIERAPARRAMKWDDPR